jgi:hypothetical protein
MSSLGDFGGGYDPDDANPEDEVNQKLSRWLVRQEKTRVYWDRKRSYGHGTFSISTQTTPDLVIRSAANNYAVEVKRENNTSDIYDSLWQVIGYWRDIVDGSAEYTVENDKIEINGVLLATDNSPNGHIFSSKNNTDPRRSERSSDGDAEGVHYPSVEHAASQVFLRLLYRCAKREYKRLDLNSDTGIGCLYSSALDGDEQGVQTAIPAAFHLDPGAQSGRVQNWDMIPFFKQDNE